MSLKDEVKYVITYGRDASNTASDSLLHVLQRDAYEVYRAHFDLPEFSVGKRWASWEEWEDIPYIDGGSLWREVDLKRYELKDHLGNVRVIVSDLRRAKLVAGVPTDFTALIKHYSNYYPFGMEKEAMVWDKGGYRYGFNGKENDDEVSGVANNVDFGARMYDSRLGRWLSVDPLAIDYPSNSPFNFVENTPIRAIDPDGKDIYILFATTGNDHGDAMFKSSAQTRKQNIEKSKFFDPAKDKVVVLQITDISQIKTMVENTVRDYSQQYGATKEVGIWSHAARQGPIGTEPTSSNAIGSTQMSLDGWEDINFNWKGSDASMTFYGCNTGNELSTTGEWQGSFARKISELPNYINVDISGQSTSAYPSFYPNLRVTNIARSKYPVIGYAIGDTYLIGGNKGEGKDSMWFNPTEAPIANRMNIYKNGKKIGSGFQSTTNSSPVYAY